MRPVRKAWTAGELQTLSELYPAMDNAGIQMHLNRSQHAIQVRAYQLGLHKLVRRPAIHGHTVGEKRSPEYHTWQAIKARCLNHKLPAYHWYGARGIQM